MGILILVGAIVALGLRYVAKLDWPIAGAVGAASTVGLYLLSVWNWRRFRAERAAVARDGQRVKCWVVRANASLYRRSLFGDPYNWADVVFTFERDVPDLDRALAAIAQRLVRFRPGPEASVEERRVATVISIKVPNPNRTSLPASLTGGLKAYLVSTQVMRDLLPKGKLTRPYIWASGRVEDSSGEVVMLPYGHEEEAEPDATADPAGT
jgi:hypothetical protein